MSDRHSGQNRAGVRTPEEFVEVVFLIIQRTGTKMKVVAALACVFFSASCFAASNGKINRKPDVAAIQGFMDLGSRIHHDYAVIGAMERAVGKPSFDDAAKAAIDAKEDAMSAEKDFDAGAAPAVRAAGANERLANTIKDYYAAASACFESAAHSSQTTRENCEKMDTSEKSLILELNLAQ